MPNQRTFMTLDCWIDFIGQEEAEKHLKNMQQTNNAFTIFSVCQDAKTNQK